MLEWRQPSAEVSVSWKHNCPSEIELAMLYLIEASNPVVPIGYFGHDRSGVATNNGDPKNMAPPPVPPKALLGGPRVITPYQVESGAPFPAKLGSMPQRPGYQEAHKYYTQLREYFAKKAWTNSDSINLILIKAWMVTRIPGKKKELYISVR